MGHPFKNGQNWSKGIPLTGIDKILIGLSLLVLVVSLAHLGVVYPTLPETVPNHIGFNGEPDGYGHRYELLIFAAVEVACWVLLFICNFRPEGISLPKALVNRRPPEAVVVGTRYFLNSTLLVVTLLVAYILESTIQIALGTMGLSVAVIWGLVAVLIIIIAVYCYWLWRGHNE